MRLTWRGPKSNLVLCVSTIIALGLGLLPLRPATLRMASTPSNADSPTQSVSCQGTGGLSCAAFTLDNVHLQVETPFLPSPFIVAVPGMIEIASSYSRSLDKELSITVVPFRTTPGTESLPVAVTGEARAYLSALHDFRTAHAAVFSGAPPITLFGQQIQGLASLSYAYNPGPAARTLIVEWVGESGQRLWIIRAAWLQDPSTSTFGPTQAAFLQSLGAITLTSDNPNAPTSVGVASASAYATALGAPQLASFVSIQVPTWWTAAPGYTNICDTGHYSTSSPLSTDTYMPNLFPCGPMARLVGDVYPYEQFPSGSQTEEEWQCVEFSMRWLYQQYLINPYPVDGGMGVVWRYTGSRLNHVINDGNSGPETYSYNGTNVPAYGSQLNAPEPGDVISFRQAGTYGHTGVVASASVDTNGNGSVVMVDQNDDTKFQNLILTNWVLSGWIMPATGWLHDPVVNAANLLANASFDNGMGVSYWTKEDLSNPGAETWSIVSLGGAHDGCCYLAAWTNNASAGYRSVLQTIYMSVPVNQSYTFSVWVKTASPTPANVGVDLWAQGGGSTEGTYAATIVAVNGTWTLLQSGLTVASSGHTSLLVQLVMYSANEEYDFDGGGAGAKPAV